MAAVDRGGRIAVERTELQFDQLKRREFITGLQEILTEPTPCMGALTTIVVPLKKVFEYALAMPTPP